MRVRVGGARTAAGRSNRACRGVCATARPVRVPRGSLCKINFKKRPNPFPYSTARSS